MEAKSPSPSFSLRMFSLWDPVKVSFEKKPRSLILASVRRNKFIPELESRALISPWLPWKPTRSVTAESALQSSKLQWSPPSYGQAHSSGALSASPFPAVRDEWIAAGLG